MEDFSGNHRRSWAHNLWEVNYWPKGLTLIRGVPVGSCLDKVRMEEEKVEVKVQQEEVKDKERDNEESIVRIEERTDNDSSA